jgi:hypothetical protein
MMGPAAYRARRAQYSGCMLRHRVGAARRDPRACIDGDGASGLDGLRDAETKVVVAPPPTLSVGIRSTKRVLSNGYQQRGGR